MRGFKNSTAKGKAMNMKKAMTLIGAAVLSALPLAAFAQTAASEVQRNINQQERIEQGLKSGALTTHEAAKLEREQAAVNRMQSQALRDGHLTEAEKARIQR